MTARWRGSRRGVHAIVLAALSLALFWVSAVPVGALLEEETDVDDIELALDIKSLYPQRAALAPARRRPRRRRILRAARLTSAGATSTTPAMTSARRRWKRAITLRRARSGTSQSGDQPPTPPQQHRSGFNALVNTPLSPPASRRPIRSHLRATAIAPQPARRPPSAPARNAPGNPVHRNAS